MKETRRRMTLNLAGAEMQFLEELCVRKGVSKTAAIRQALRLYQVVEDRTDKGKKMFFVDNSTKERSELMLL